MTSVTWCEAGPPPNIISAAIQVPVNGANGRGVGATQDETCAHGRSGPHIASCDAPTVRRDASHLSWPVVCSPGAQALEDGGGARDSCAWPNPSPRALKIFLRRQKWPAPHHFLTSTPRPRPSSRHLDRNLIAHHWPVRAPKNPRETPPCASRRKLLA